MRIVQCHGCFDLLHIGHIRHLQAAKQMGDTLIVTVTPDAFVNKGPGRPVFSLAQRMEALQALQCVDLVCSSESATATKAIREIRPSVFVKGSDYTEATMDPEEVAAVKAVGGEIVFTTTTKWSSTALLQQPLYSIRDWFASMRKLKVLVIGDAIRDEYHYVNTLGKAGKEPILAAQFVKAESFHGGAEAVYHHAEACSDSVNLQSGPCTVKRRFVESYPFQKLFEIYEMDEAAAAQRADILASGPWPNCYDLGIIADYGHGFLTQALIHRADAVSKFLAVNTQANAGNQGFNTISKYPKADFVSLSERELRLDTRDQVTPIADLMRKQPYERLLITRGAHGCMLWMNGQIYEAPALETHPVDRIGAGDAVFAISACCAAVGMPGDLLVKVAAVAGTQAVGIVGNASYLQRESLIKAIEDLA